jgi:hypothetical protein
MNNSYFLYAKSGEEIVVPRFHICTWEFRNGGALIEFGCELDKESIKGRESVTLCLFVPWLFKGCKIEDFFPKLIDQNNLRLIFNDGIKGSKNINEQSNTSGIRYTFVDRFPICIVPVQLEQEGEKVIGITFNLGEYQKLPETDRSNIYCRFSLDPKLEYISTRKNGIGRSTIIYDIKLNERRNIPQENLGQLEKRTFCHVNHCFCLNIVPNSYDLVFFDSTALRNVRTLESKAFNTYLGGKRVREDDLLVVFNKRSGNSNDPGSCQFSFFLMLAKERVGATQFVLAIFVNLLCGVLFLLASTKQAEGGTGYLSKICGMSFEFWIAITLIGVTAILFGWPMVRQLTSGLLKRKKIRK